MKKFRRFITMSLAILMVMAIVPFAAMTASADGTGTTVSGRVRLFDAVTGKRITVSGAELIITPEGDSGEAKTVVTDSTGTTSLTDVVVGETYSVKMKTPPAGYAMDSETFSMTVTEDKLTTIGRTVYFTHELKCAPIYGQLTQKDADGNTIKESGAVYCVYDSNGKLFSTITTDSNGVAAFKKPVPYGTYTVAQKKPSIGFFMDSEKRIFTVSDKTMSKQSDGSFLTNYDYVNDALVAKLVLKDGKYSLKQSRAKFELYDADGNLLEELETDKNGEAIIETKLAYAHYVVKTVSDPAGFITTVNEFDVREELFEKQEDGTMVYLFKIPEEHIKGLLDLTAVGKVLVGMEEKTENGFTVSKPVFEDMELNGFIYEINAQEDIVINWNKVAKADEVEMTYTTGKSADKEHEYFLGNYWVREIAIDKAYIAQPEDKELVFEQNGRKAQVKVEMPITYEHKMTKVTANVEAEFAKVVENEDGTVNSLYEMKGTDGYKFGLYTAEDFTMTNTDKKDKEVRTFPADTLVAVANADENGNVVFFEMLPLGKYYIQQIESADGYEPNIYKFNFNTTEGVADEQGIINVTASGTSQNVLVKNTAVVKSMFGDTPLADTHVVVLNEKEEVVFAGTTEENGNTTEMVLVPGTYTARETIATNGYEWNDSVVTFVVKAEGETESPVIGHIPAKYVMLSVDEEGNPQAGAEFTLYLNNEGVATATANADGIVEFDNLVMGKYQVKETVAVDGYRRNPENHEFEINDTWKNNGNYDADGKATHVFHNAKATMFSEIGENVEDMSTGAKVGIIAGVAAVIAAVAAAVVVSKEKKNGNKKA